MFNQDMSSYQAEKVIVVNAGQYYNMEARPFTMFTPQEKLEQFIFDTNNGLNINQNSVMGTDGSIIDVAGSSLGTIGIDGGWQAQRNVYMMIIRDTITGTRYVLNGFTSPDFCVGNSINPYGEITFNSVIELVNQTDYSGNNFSIVGHADNILSANEMYGKVSGQQVSNTLRPVDVLQDASTRIAIMSDGIGDNMDNTHITSIGNSVLASTGSRNACMSRTGNSSANDYLYRTTKAFNDAALTHLADDLTDVVDASMGSSLLAEQRLSSHSLIQNILSNASAMRNATVTWSELEFAIPNINMVVQTVQGEGTAIGMQEDWGGRSNEVRLASSFAAAIAAEALGNCIAEIHFTINSNPDHISGYNNTMGIGNMLPKKNPMMVNNDIAFIAPNLPEMELLERFKARVRSVIFPSIVGAMNVEFHISVEVLEDMTVGVSCFNGHLETRTAPTFASSSWNPVSVGNMQSSQEMARGMTTLTNFIHSARAAGMTHSPSTAAVDYMQSLPTNGNNFQIF